MQSTDIEKIKAAIRMHWSNPPNVKVQRYIGQFYDHIRIGKKIMAKVEGNYGTYTVSITAKESTVDSACSCYIGKEGDCHHCQALAACRRRN